MKKLIFILVFLVVCMAPITYCMTPEQRALMATKSLKERAALTAIQKIYADCHGDRLSIETAIRTNEMNLPTDLLPLLAKYWFLLYGTVKNILDYEENRDFIASELDYNYSIDELRVFHKLPTPVVRSNLGLTLDLGKLRINDLTGLAHVPEIGYLNCLLLRDNQINELQPNTFIGVNNLHLLSLGRNQIQELKADAFKGLTQLTELVLYNNQLTELPDILKTLTSLKTLYLDGNPISKLDIGVFNNNDNSVYIVIDAYLIDKDDRNVFRTHLQAICPQVRINFLEYGASV